MVKHQHKVLSLILCAALLFTALMCGTVSAFAAAGDTIYVRVNNSWSNVYCYMWTDGDQNAAWPGIQMTKVSNGVYSYTLPKAYANVIFNNGSGGGTNQTGDMIYPGGGQIYDLSAGSWSAYSNDPTPTQGTTPVVNPTNPVVNPTNPVSGGVTVYLKNTAGWSNPNCYMWNSESDKNGSWPGVAMTKVEGNVYSYTASKEYAGCIFNSGGGSPQTADLTTMNGQIYDNSTNTWSVYDTSPIQIKSYSADPDSSVYVGTTVDLSANAVSTSGTIVYKFSVTNASGATSEIAQNYTGVASWTPTATGNYTIKFEFSDTAGNTNSRTMKINVENDASLVNPIIKSITPGNLNMIKRNVSATVSVSAGGGKTGTNLLFYKYIVKDPNGVSNTPYYTLNSTYSFTPTMLGKYTVEVFVQSSDNTTVNKTYTYTATDSDVTVPTNVTTPPVVPTSPTSASGYQVGDVNMDGAVNVKDATFIQKYIAKYVGYLNINVELGDVTGDGVVTVKDATAIQRMINM